MSTIEIPYALSQLNTFTFKEINTFDAIAIGRIVSELHSIHTTPMQEKVDIPSQLKQKRLEILQQAPKMSAKYFEVKNKLDRLMATNRKIFDKDIELSDEDNSIKLSWILFGTSRQEQLDKHREKYHHIYAQKYQLEKEMRSYAPYIPQYINATIDRELNNLSTRLEQHNVNIFEDYRENQQRKHSACKQRLSTICNSIHLYDGLVSALRIDSTGNICTLSCSWRSLYDGQRKYVKKTLFNTPCQIIR